MAQWDSSGRQDPSRNATNNISLSPCPCIVPQFRTAGSDLQEHDWLNPPVTFGWISTSSPLGKAPFSWWLSSFTTRDIGVFSLSLFSLHYLWSWGSLSFDTILYFPFFPFPVITPSLKSFYIHIVLFSTLFISFLSSTPLQFTILWDQRTTKPSLWSQSSPLL